MVHVVKAAPSGAVTVYVMTTSETTGDGGVSEISVMPEETVVVMVTTDGAGGFEEGEATAGAVAVIVMTSWVDPSPPGRVTVKTVMLAGVGEAVSAGEDASDPYGLTTNGKLVADGVGVAAGPGTVVAKVKVKLAVLSE